jgi:hypothetical protein
MVIHKKIRWACQCFAVGKQICQQRIELKPISSLFKAFTPTSSGRENRQYVLDAPNERWKLISFNLRTENQIFFMDCKRWWPDDGILF